MNRFRYDFVIRKTGAKTPPGAQRLLASVLAPVPCSLASLRVLLAGAPEGLRVTGIPNARVGNAGGALDPEDVRAMAPDHDVEVRFSRERDDAMDVVFRRRAASAWVEPLGEAPPGPPSRYANTPQVRVPLHDGWPAVLREHMKQKLPEPMLPASIVVLDALPRTANGKVDRGKLAAHAPVPSKGGAARAASAEGEVEQAVAEVFSQLLGRADVGRDENFFDIGANSLMMVQASVRLCEALGRSVSIVHLFQYPTVRALAASLTAATHDHLHDGDEDRARTRQDALQRQREQRSAGRAPEPEPRSMKSR
jgi:acyl carrier protein